VTLQFIHDNKGNTTGVFIPIEEWEKLKVKYEGLQKEEMNDISHLSAWQKEFIDERLKDYYSNPEELEDFDKTVENILNKL
jgi:guanylate kinase